jgi:UDP-3-O-[3-hydroxymyristoyl] glucosamine N-acyltransferase
MRSTLIDNSLLLQTVAVSADEEVNCNFLGPVDCQLPNTLTFLDDEKFVSELVENPLIAAVFVTQELSPLIPSRVVKIVVDEPRFYFFTLLNYLSERSYEKFDSVIDKTAQIHSTAFVNDYNVRIGARTLIEPNVTVLADVTIGQDCVIRAGAVIGSEGFEHKRTSRGILPVRHDGGVELKDKVEIGSNSCVDKGFSFRQTIIGSETKIDNLVHIGHGVQTGARCLFAACSMAGGSVTYGDDVWVGPNATVVSGLNVGSGAKITLGAVVTKDVAEGERVTGNFAISHGRFLENLKKAAR